MPTEMQLLSIRKAVLRHSLNRIESKITVARLREKNRVIGQQVALWRLKRNKAILKLNRVYGIAPKTMADAFGLTYLTITRLVYPKSQKDSWTKGQTLIRDLGERKTK